MSCPRELADDTIASVRDGVLGEAWRGGGGAGGVLESPSSSQQLKVPLSALLRVRRLPADAHLVLPEEARLARPAIPPETTCWWHSAAYATTTTTTSATPCRDRDGAAARLERLLDRAATSVDDESSRDGFWIDCGSGLGVSAIDAVAARNSLTLPEDARWVASLSALDTGLPSLSAAAAEEGLLRGRAAGEAGTSSASWTASAGGATTAAVAEQVAAMSSPSSLWTLSEESTAALRRKDAGRSCVGVACFF